MEMKARATRTYRSARPGRNRRRRNWFRFARNCLLLALFGELMYLALTSPYLRITRIDARGMHSTSAAEARAAGANAMGKNILLARTDRIRQRLLRNPAIVSARIYRLPPNRLILSIRERRPAAMALAGGNLYLIDSNGFVYKETTTRRRDVPTVELAGSDALRIGSRDHWRLTLAALECLKRACDESCQASEISVDPNSNMCLNMESGLRVRLGRPQDLDRKLAALKTVLAAKPEMATEASYIDISCVTAPAWKLKKESSTL
jgi:cell division protein FtsQ